MNKPGADQQERIKREVLKRCRSTGGKASQINHANHESSEKNRKYPRAG